MFEIDGVADSIARGALRLGAMKLPVTTRVVQREIGKVGGSPDP